MISTSSVAIQFGAKPLFENISVKFGNGNCYGLIGANGCGKSTFMQILSDKLTPTAGSVSIEDGLRLSTLNQDQFAFENYSVLDTVIMGHKELWQIKAERERIYSLPDMSEKDALKVSDLEEEFAAMDGYAAEANAGELLLGVGIETEQHDQPMSKIAPGRKLRILLVQALFSNPDIMLLDEPTNNLDIHTIGWLEDVLSKHKSTIIVISHDRHFLNKICTHTADLDYGQLRVYPGNYDSYMLASTQAREQLLSSNTKKKEQIAELQDFVRRFSANASKAKQATSRARQIEKIQLDEVKVSSRVNPYIVFKQDKPLFRNALTAEKISKSYGDLKILQNLNLTIKAGEKVAIIGDNGIGKTTLLRALVADIDLDTGEIKKSDNANIGYFPQDNSKEFDTNTSLLDWLTKWRTSGDDDQIVRGILGRLLFSKDDVNKSVLKISGGERGRMLFGKLMINQHNILVMDEPTNHLDMESIESLNIALQKYEGTLIFASHDREFVSSLANRIIELKTDGLVDFSGTYDEYLISQDITS